MILFCCRYPNAAEEISPVKEKKRLTKIRQNVRPKVSNDLRELGANLETAASHEVYATTQPLAGQEIREKFFQVALEGRYGTTLVFGSPYLINSCLRESTNIFVDGTFKILPQKPKARQLLTIQAEKDANVSST